jgi:hypothetical protein
MKIQLTFPSGKQFDIELPAEIAGQAMAIYAPGSETPELDTTNAILGQVLADIRAKASNAAANAVYDTMNAATASLEIKESK